MKKATLLTFLFAVLMIALLVSCNTPPDPLPDETTTGDVTPEVTPEPTDVTSDEAEVSEPVETTTEAVTTRKEYETSRYGSMDHEFYVFMEPIVTEYWSDEKPDEPVQIVDTDAPWVITEWETDIPYKPRKEWVEIPEEKANLAIRVPKCIEYVDNDVSVKMEFFQEYYPIGTRFPIRYTVTNLNPDQNLSFRPDRLGYIDNKHVDLNYSGPYLGLFPFVNDEVRWYSRTAYSETLINSITLLSASKAENVEQTRTTLEFLYALQPGFFDAEEKTDITLYIRVWSGASHVFKFPFEIVEVEYIDP